MDVPPVSLTEIAELAEVRRPSVSNWRRRHADFPKPVGGSATIPLFSADEVATWLDRRPLTQSASTRLGLRVNGTRPTYGDVFRTGLTLRAITITADGRSPDAVALDGLAALAGVSETPLNPDSGTSAHRHLARLSTETGTTDAAEKLLAAVRRLGASWASTATPPAICTLVAALVAELSDGVEGLAVADLAAGSGGLLTGLLTGPFHTHGAPRAVWAAEPVADLRELLRLRLLCHGLPAAGTGTGKDAGTDTGESSDIGPEIAIMRDGFGPEVPFPDAGADIILADPPFQPSERAPADDHPLRWAERALQCLGPDGLGFAVVPEWTLSTTSQGGAAPAVVRAREDLLRRHCLLAVIQLPRRIHPFLTGAELALLILAPEGSRTTVTLCDADRIADQHAAAKRSNWVDGWAAETARLIGRPRERRHPEVCRDLPTEHLLNDRPLLPSLRLAPVSAAADHVDSTAAARQAAAVAFASGAATVTVTGWLSRLTTAPRTAPVRYERLGNLIRSGQIRLLPGHRIPADGLGTHGQRVYGREELTGERAMGERRIDPLVLARYPAAFITDPGDVIVLAEDGLRTVVDETGGSVLLFPVQGLRIKAYGELRGPNAAALGRDAKLRLRPHQLAAMISSRRNARRARGSLVRRVDLRSLEIPALSPDETAELDGVIRDLAQHTENLKRQLAAIERLGDDLAASVADGALTLRMRAP